MKPSEWSLDDKECVKEIARIAAIAAIEALFNRISSAIMNRVWFFVSGWLAMQLIQYLMTHPTTLKGI